jgi:hypothetical protein
MADGIAMEERIKLNQQAESRSNLGGDNYL